MLQLESETDLPNSCTVVEASITLLSAQHPVVQSVRTLGAHLRGKHGTAVLPCQRPRAQTPRGGFYGRVRSCLKQHHKCLDSICIDSNRSKRGVVYCGIQNGPQRAHRLLFCALGAHAQSLNKIWNHASLYKGLLRKSRQANT